MFEPLEPNAGLNLVLQNGEASPFDLALALLQEFYSPVYRLAQALMGKAQAESAVQHVFVAMVQNAGSYRESTDLFQWFYDNFFKTIKIKDLEVFQGPLELRRDPVFQAIAPQARLPVLMHYLAGLDSSQIASILRQDLAMVEARLPRAARTTVGVGTADGQGADSLDALLSKSLVSRWPAPAVDPSRLETLAAEIAQQAGLNHASQTRSKRLRQAAAMAAVFLTVLVILLITSPIRPDSTASQSGVITVVITRLVTATPVPDLKGSDWSSISAYSGLMAPTPEFPGLKDPTWSSAAAWRDMGPPPLPEGSATPGAGLLTAPFSEPRLLFAQDTPQAAYPAGSQSRPVQLSDTSSSEDIAAAIQSNDASANTVWIDALATFHIPPGYVGPARQYRYQAWTSRDRALILGGPPEGPPQETWVGQGDRLIYFPRGYPPVELTGEGFIQPLSLKRPLIGGLNLLFNPNLAETPNSIFKDQTFKIIGTSYQANRAALVVDKIDTLGQRFSRLWIDKRTGLVLRDQQFRPGTQDVTVEVEVKTVAYDAAFDNPALFDLTDPWRGGFTADVAGHPLAVQSAVTPVKVDDPRPQAQKTPPPGFNPSQSRLSFYYPVDFDLFKDRVAVGLSADGYYLGDIPFGNPWNMICARSQDGSKLAFASKPLVNTFYQPSNIYWFDLAKVPILAEGPLEINADEIAFAPDNRHLAVIGHVPGSRPGVFLADLQSRDVILLRTMAAQSLAWRPDGELLGMIGMEYKFSPEIMVLDAGTGDIVYRSSLAMLMQGATSAIAAKWEVNFPSAVGRLEACVNPPKK